MNKITETIARCWKSLLHFSKDKTKRTRYTVSKPYIRFLHFLVGEKDCLRWHHIHNLNRTNGQFEEWWETEHKDFLSELNR